MKILLISGFLGAGKTTFIKELSKRTKSEIAILENELGTQNIDVNRIKKEDNSINIWEMTEGCICCSSKNDLSLSVLTISNSVDPEYLVIEPTGVGMLGNILNNLSKVLYERISLIAPITIVDGLAFKEIKRDYSELFLDQVKNAKTIIVSKLEGKDEKDKEEILAFLKELNENASIVTTPYKELPDSFFNELLLKGFDGNIPEIKEEKQTLDTFSLKEASIPSPTDLIIFLENMIKGHYGNIVRAKGTVKTDTEKLRFDLASGNYIIEGTEEDDEEQVVFIGKDIKRQDIRIILLSAVDGINLIRKK